MLTQFLFASGLILSSTAAYAQGPLLFESVQFSGLCSSIDRVVETQSFTLSPVGQKIAILEMAETGRFGDEIITKVSIGFQQFDVLVAHMSTDNPGPGSSRVALISPKIGTELSAEFKLKLGTQVYCQGRVEAKND